MVQNEKKKFIWRVAKKNSFVKIRTTPPRDR